MIDTYDEPVDIVPGTLRMSVAAMASLKKATGRGLGELLQDDDETLKFQTMAFVELFRRYARLGHIPDAGELWERAEMVELNFVQGAPEVDPTSGATSTISLPSVDIGE